MLNTSLPMKTSLSQICILASSLTLGGAYVYYRHLQSSPAPQHSPTAPNAPPTPVLLPGSKIGVVTLSPADKPWMGSSKSSIAVRPGDRLFPSAVPNVAPYVLPDVVPAHQTPPALLPSSKVLRVIKPEDIKPLNPQMQ